MTEQEFYAKLIKYRKKEKYYRRKADKLEAEYFEELNKDNKLLKVLKEQTKGE